MSVKTTQPMIGSNQHDFWRRLYIRILMDGVRPTDKLTKDELALELGAIEDLVEAGFMASKVHKDASGIPVLANTRGPTLAGRIFAEEQQDILDKKSIFGRIKSGTGLFIGWLSGIISAIIIWRLTK
jgi:hypothetical protein